MFLLCSVWSVLIVTSNSFTCFLNYSRDAFVLPFQGFLITQDWSQILIRLWAVHNSGDSEPGITGTSTFVTNSPWRQ